MNTRQYDQLFTDLTPKQAEVIEGGKTFATWGTNWKVRSYADPNAPVVGTINQTAPGPIEADYQVYIGKDPIKYGSYSSRYMAHITGPIDGYITTIAVKGEGEKLDGIPTPIRTYR